MKFPQETNLLSFKKNRIYNWGSSKFFFKDPRFEAPTTGQSEMELVKEDGFSFFSGI